MKKIAGDKGFSFILLSPALFLFFACEIYPFLYGIYLTFSKGGHYYRYVISDPNLILSFKITLLYSILSVLCTLFLGFLFAITFERELKLKPIYEILFFIPWVIPKYIFIISFRAILHGYNGSSLFNTLFGTQFNLENSTFYSWVAILLVSVILSLPLNTLIIKNALGTTDKELKYVSQIDGATPLEYYINIALPQIYPTLIPFITLEFIKAFKVFNAVYLLTLGGPPLLEGFGEKSIVGATTTLSLLSYSMFSEGDDPIIGISYSVIIGIIVLFFLLLLFFSFHITRKYRKYKGIFITLPFIFHFMGLFSNIGIGIWEIGLISIYTIPLYFYIKRKAIFRKIFGYSFSVDLIVNILFIWQKGSPFAFSIGTVFTFFMFLFIRPSINIWRKREIGYREFYERALLWLSNIITVGFYLFQEKFIRGTILFLIPFLEKAKLKLKYITLFILLVSLFTLNGFATKIIISILIFTIIISPMKWRGRDNHPLFHLFIGIYLFVLILPIYTILWISLSKKNTILMDNLFPYPITFSNFSEIILKENFLLFVKNSLFVSILTFFLLILFSLGFSIYIARKKTSFAIFAKNTMVYISAFTGIYTLLPLYIVFHKFHLLNNLGALSFVFTANALPLSILTLSGALSNLPKSFEEAASLDGAKPFQIIIHIMIPLIKPSIIVSGILGFMGAWGEFFTPLIFLNNPEKYTIPIKLFYYVGELGSQHPLWTLFSAGSVLSSLPVLVLFWITKKKQEVIEY